MAKSKNFTGTFNNPPMTLEEFLEILKKLPGATSGRAQLEKGEEGTPHFQWCVSFKGEKQEGSIRK